MQFKNPFIDNLSKVMADAFGAAHSAKTKQRMFPRPG